MSEILDKIQFLIKRKPVVIITGEGRDLAEKAILTILKEKTLFLISADDKEINKFEFFLKNSKLSILVITRVGDIPFQQDFFAGEREKLEKTIELAKKLKAQNWLILNYDDETVREIDDITNLNTLTFGFSERADFFATDIKLNHGTNFKVNHKGNIVPFWLEGTFGKEQIYSALAAAALGTIFGLNLVEISQLMREYKTLPGKMRLIEGIKGSLVLDDTESATVFSMIEAVEILGKVPVVKRKIAVLGDVIGIGKYTIEAHETIGEKVAKNTNLLFTFGPRAKFIAKGAIEKRMEETQIFSFDRIEDGIEKLKETIRGGDLILVDGSKEMRMSEIVDQIRKIW
jgi:UDP-N-acetylmuramoyl-tripeptide--D-alanyl-D-alanine ligase